MGFLMANFLYDGTNCVAELRVWNCVDVGLGATLTASLAAEFGPAFLPLSRA